MVSQCIPAQNRNRNITVINGAPTHLLARYTCLTSSAAVAGDPVEKATVSWNLNGLMIIDNVQYFTAAYTSVFL